MTIDHRAATGLCHIADEQSRPSDGLGALRVALDKVHQDRVAPIAVAREPHHLPVRPVDGERNGSRETAVRIATNGMRYSVRRLKLGAEQFLGRFGAVGTRQFWAELWNLLHARKPRGSRRKRQNAQ